MSKLLSEIKRRIEAAADEAFDEETAIDSDGIDQALREGMLHSLEIVEDEFRKAGEV